MINRQLLPELTEALQQNSAVAILGPRQVGKTTLALEAAKSLHSVYLDLESPLDQAKLQDPLGYLSSNKDKLMIIDEIHRKPELFPILRGIIDEQRRSGKSSGQFLLLGSASIELLNQSSETLAGRIRYLELGLLNYLEAANSINTLWVRGGFPSSYLAKNDRQSAQWREDFIRTYLERDIPLFGQRVPATTMRRLWTMLAHLQGSMVNASKLATGLDISNKTITRYMDLLCDLLLVRKLQPYHRNTGKRLVKSPKMYVRDSGLLHQLLHISSLEGLLSYPLVGESWEGFVIENMLSVASSHVTSSFYRTGAGAEIDLVLELPNREIWAIEIKRNSVPKVSKGFHLACDDIKPTKKFVIYQGQEQFQLPHRVTAIGLHDIMDLLLGSQ